MLRFLTAFALACLALPAFSQSGMTNITASHIESDMSGALLTGKLCLTPVRISNPNNPVAFTANGGAQVLPNETCYPVTAGVLNINVPDTSLAQPNGVGYKVALKLSSGYPLYTYSQPIQPNGTTWSLDSWTPTQSANITTPSLSYSANAPSGACTAPAVWYTGTVGGTTTSIYTCVGQAWVLLQTSGSGGAQADWTAVSGPAVVLHKPALATVATSGSYPDLLNKPTIPAAQVNSDWNASTGLAQILNKPTIPAAQVNSDWNASSGLSQILNKPTIPAAQVSSDWNATSGVSQILNKPSIPSSGDAIASLLVCADTSGSGTAQSCATSPSFTPVANDCVIYSTTTANTGTGLTLNVNGIGGRTVAKWLGASTLAAGDIPANAPQLACYTGTVWNVSTVGNVPSGTGSGIGSIAWSLPTWLTASPSTLSASGTEAISASTGQTPHQVIGTCGSATSFAPCSLVAADIPALPYQTPLGFTPVANTITVNGYPLSGNVTVTASDITSGTLPHAQLPALLSADIPNNAANTSGTAAGLSGSRTANYVYAAPNGTAGTAAFRTVVAADIPALSYQAPLGFTPVANTVTVNGHALSANVTVSASDLTTGTLPHAQLPTLVSGDIPNNGANTSGSAASLSAASALPSGTTATTQTAGDNSTKVATTAFVTTAIAPIYSNNGLALPTSSIAANACTAATGSPFTATGVTTSNVATFGWAGDPTSVTGYGSTGGLTVRVFPGSGTVAVKVCNPNSSAITPGSISINVRVTQ